MCSDPQEVHSKTTGEVHTVACRVCDECLATRRHEWVARAMAERALWPFTLAITLTYSDARQEWRDAAKVFAYVDVSDWLKRVRAAASEVKPDARLRFICAGEQGDRNGRCHWHVIVYSDTDIRLLGEVLLRGRPVAALADLMSVGKVKRRLNWSLWPAGFVTFQEPDLGGMHYVLSYCLKDQFTYEKSKRAARVAKSENFATGLFRMSKRPAIGEPFIWRVLGSLDARGAVLPSATLKVPGFPGYWHPHGDLRKQLLWGFRAINQRVRWSTGRDAPQWSTLLASCEASDSDMEALLGGSEEQTSLEFQLDHKQRQHTETGRLGEFRRRCGSQYPCNECLRGFPAWRVKALGLKPYIATDGETVLYKRLDGGHFVRKRQGRINPLCGFKGSAIARRAFPKSGGEAP